MDYTTLTDLNGLINFIKGASQNTSILWFAILGTIIYIKTVIRTEKTITRIEDDAHINSEKRIKHTLGEKMTLLKNKLYDPVNRYIYQNLDNGKKLRALREKTIHSIPANRFVEIYNTALKDVFYKIALPYLIDEIELANIKFEMPNHDVIEDIACNLREKIIMDIHKQTGIIKEIEEIETSVFIYSDVEDIVISCIKAYISIKQQEKAYIEKETKAYRIPLLPTFFKGKK